MECPKCHKSTVVKVTTKNKKKVKEKKGLFHLALWIITFPIYGAWVLLFGRKRVNYSKQVVWNCRYCNHTWKDKNKGEDEE